MKIPAFGLGRFGGPHVRHQSSSGELLLARGLTKTFVQRRGFAHTLAQRLLRRRTGAVPIFEGVDFTLFAGECVAVHGPNGSGKSTLLRCLAGVIEPSTGEVLRIGRTVGLLAHGFGAYEELPVWKNIVLAQQLLGLSRRRAKDNMESVAVLAGLQDRMLSPTSQLSEGMRAKISLAALAVADFDVALLDESLNHVDTDFRQQFLDLTRKWIAEGRSLLVTSHDEHLLTRFATRQVRIENKTLTNA